MSQRIARSVLYSGCCGARIVFVRVKVSPRNLFVVSIYLPHSGRQAPSASDTLAELEVLLSKVHQHDCVVLHGDFNATLARHTDIMTGRWCIHRRANPAGDRLLGLMDRLQLCAVSTLHQPRRSSTNATLCRRTLDIIPHRSTMSWYPPDGLRRHTIFAWSGG